MIQDLYVEYLVSCRREELRALASQQNVPWATHMDKDELIVALLDKKIFKAEAHVVTTARVLHSKKNQGALMELHDAVNELEGLHEIRQEWLENLTKRKEKASE